MKTLLVLTIFAMALSVSGQAIINSPPITLNATGSTAVLAWMAGQGTGTITTITAPVAPGDTTITVDVSVGIGVNSVISIGTGHMLVTAKAGKVLTVTRGYNGTVAGTHAAGAVVTEMKYRTLNMFGRLTIMDALKPIVAASTALNAPLLAAEADKKTAVEGAVQ